MIEQYSGNPSDFTIGIAAASRHQEDESGRHAPRLAFEVPPADEFFTGYLAEAIGYGSTREERTFPSRSYHFYGHTGVFVRVEGMVRYVYGFSPRLDEFLAVPQGDRMTTTFGGMWKEDDALLRDPASVSIEFNVRPRDAYHFNVWFCQNSCRINRYSMTQGDWDTSFNCLMAAITIVKIFLDACGEIEYLDYIQRLERFNDFSQGRLIRMILDGSFWLG